MLLKRGGAPLESLPGIAPVGYPRAVSSLGSAAYTLFVTPPHEKLHQIVEAAANEVAQPMQATLEGTEKELESTLSLHTREQTRPQLDGRRLVQFAGILIQFTDYNRSLDRNVTLDYEPIADLRDAVSSRAEDSGPLGFAEQLDVALEQSEGDMTNALWNLFIASRLHARWLDGRLVSDLPAYTTEEKIKLMLEWRSSITACKPHDGKHAQDPTGDAYYAWTHALAKYMYSLAPATETATSRAAVRTFHHGTGIMHRVVHTFNKQGVESDHAVAAEYGNMIGRVCLGHASVDKP